MKRQNKHRNNWEEKRTASQLFALPAFTQSENGFNDFLIATLINNSPTDSHSHYSTQAHKQMQCGSLSLNLNIKQVLNLKYCTCLKKRSQPEKESSHFKLHGSKKCLCNKCTVSATRYSMLPNHREQTTWNMQMENSVRFIYTIWNKHLYII